MGSGVLFEWDMHKDTLSKLIAFSEDDGATPMGSLTQGLDGSLYGMSKLGGSDEVGTLFRWDPLYDSIAKVMDFNKYDNGSLPTGSLLKFDNTVALDTMYAEDCKTFLSPSGKYFWINTGTYRDLLIDKTGCDSLVMVKLKINRSTGTLSQVLCDTMISPSGKYTWRRSGIYYDTIPDFMGCDSVITVYLTIHTIDTSLIVNKSILISNALNAKYQWIKCDQASYTNGDTARVFIARSDGNYAVIVSVDGCVDTSSCYYLTATGLINNTFKEEILLYPNPNCGSFYFDLGREYYNVLLSITDERGNNIYNEDLLYGRELQINLDSPPGIYWVTIATGNEKAVFMVIKN